LIKTFFCGKAAKAKKQKRRSKNKLVNLPSGDIM